MKDLIITNGEARYLDCSPMGSYYLPCEIIDKNETEYKIRYEDGFDDLIEVTVPIGEVEEVTEYYNSIKEIRDFLLEVKNNKISIDMAAKIIDNGGQL